MEVTMREGKLRKFLAVILEVRTKTPLARSD